MNCLIVGGTSGLGLCLAKRLTGDYKVIVTGRHDPKEAGIDYLHFDMGEKLDTHPIASRMTTLVNCLPDIHLLVYAAGFYQEGTITQLSTKDIQIMMNVGAGAPIFILKAILEEQNKLDGFIPITSTSQWTARYKEPVYNFVKAGLGLFSEAISLDPRVKKTLLAAPAGMKTEFYRDNNRDMSTMLDPDWVAERIVDHYNHNYTFRFIEILREPSRVIIQKTRIE